MIVATAGHVDHGKTTLVRALTGVDTDRLAEEKRRGLSIEPGFAYRRLDDGRVLGFVDVPGHQRFVHNMLAAVAGIDLALLVVAADDGPMPQTREHLAILGLLGIERLVAVSSCVDRVSPARRRAALTALRDLLAGGRYADAPLLESSAATGEGVDELRALLERLARTQRRRASGGRFRLAVDRRFSPPGAGVVVTGTVFAGSVAAEDRLTLLTARRTVRVRGLQVAERPATRAEAGDRVALNLTAPALHVDDLRRGDWLVAPEIDHAGERLDVRLQLLADAPRPLRHWSEVHLHAGAAHVGARVAVLGAGSLAPGQTGLVQLVATQPLHAVRGDRVVLRDQSARYTLAGGVVLDPMPPRRGRARPARLATLRALAHESPARAVRALLDAAPHGVDRDWLARSFNLDEPSLAALLRTVPHRAPSTGGEQLLVAPACWAALRAAVLEAVAAWHRERPQSAGINVSGLARLLPGGPPAPLAAAAAAELVDAGSLERTGMLVHAPGHAVTLTPEQTRTWGRVAAALAPEEGSAPSLHPLARTLQIPVDELRTLMDVAVAAGLAVPVARNRYLPLPAVRSYARAVTTVAARHAEEGFGVAEFRDHAGVGRNFAVDLLEFFDRSGLTRRLGERRRLRASAAALFGDEHSRKV